MLEPSIKTTNHIYWHTEVSSFFSVCQSYSLSANQLDYNREEVQCLKPPYTKEMFWGRNTSTSPLVTALTWNRRCWISLGTVQHEPASSVQSLKLQLHSKPVCLLLMRPYHKPTDIFLTSSSHFWWAFPILPV